MNIQYTYIPAASLEAGNQQTLAQTWFVFFSDPENQQKLNTLADTLDTVLRWRIPDQTLGGILAGKEQELRQDTLLLLIGKYLAGNDLLTKATQEGAELEADDQIRRSISAAHQISMRRLRRAMVEEAKRWASLPEDAAEWGWVCHTSDRPLFSLPYPVLLKLCLTALRRAVEQQRLSPKSAALAATMFDEGRTQAEMARRMGISRAAIHQRLGPVRQHLQSAIENQELPAL